MKFYRASIEILIRAGGEGEACDGMSGLLTETGIYDSGLIADWAYSHGPAEVDVPDDEQGREEYFADGNLNKGLPASTVTFRALEAYGREKVREGMRKAADLCDDGGLGSELCNCRQFILRIMDEEASQ